MCTGPKPLQVVITSASPCALREVEESASASGMPVWRSPAVLVQVFFPRIYFYRNLLEDLLDTVVLKRLNLLNQSRIFGVPGWHSCPKGPDSWVSAWVISGVLGLSPALGSPLIRESALDSASVPLPPHAFSLK